MFIKKAQSTLEYVVFLVVIIGVFLAMSNYVKRGVQGRWKASLDELGDQYDPRLANSFIRHEALSNSITTIWVVNGVNGVYTRRKDDAMSIDRKTGYTQSLAY